MGIKNEHIATIIIICFLLISTSIFNLLHAQVWEEKYTHTSNIKSAAYHTYSDDFAIVDKDGLLIFHDDEIIRYDKLTYALQDTVIDVDLKSAFSLDYLNGYLYAATADSSILLFHEGEFVNGVPLLEITHKTTRLSYLCVFTFRGIDAPQVIGTLDIEDQEFNPWYNDIVNSPIANYPISDMAVDQTESFLSGDGKTILNWANGEMHFNDFTFETFPFSKLLLIENKNNVNVPGGPRSRMHLWAVTDVGLAFYSSKQNLFDWGNWTEDGWTHIHKDNSPLLTNEIADLQLFDYAWATEHNSEFLAWSNDPYPTLYQINTRLDTMCRYSTKNTNLSNIPITGLGQNGRRDKVFLTQGNKISSIDIQDLICEISTSTKKSNYPHQEPYLYPNPGNDYFIIEHIGDNIKMVDVFDVMGKKMKIERDRNHVAILNATSGVYFIVVTTEKGKVIRRWVNN